jgi:Xaa-Pro aminopeptidase
MAVLIYGDTVRTPAMRHEVPIAVPDPFLYLESNGSRVVTASSIERPRLEALAGIEPIGLEDLGWDELLASGRARWDAEFEIAVRAVAHYEIDEAVVPPEFPLELANRLRSAGVDVTTDPEEFARRRRAKTAAELEGIRAAQRAADAAMGEAAALLASGTDLTAEYVRGKMQAVCREMGCTLGHDAIVGAGAQGAVGHESGSGPLPPDTTIIIDIWPQHDESGCFADMTRTFVIGTPAGDVAQWHALAIEALRRVKEAARPGVTGTALWGVACDVYEAAGQPTQRSKKPGEVLREGFFHSLGHGVGLDVHEEPNLGRGGDAELIAGDVVAVEPGAYRQGYGGVRLEDLLLITEDGSETLTDYPYDLKP